MSNDYRPPKKSNLALGSEVLQALFENGKSPLSQQFIRWKLWRKWEEFVGPTMAQASEPVGYQAGVLFVWVKNAAWMQQLVFMREPMKETINKKLQTNYVTEIRLTMDKKSVPRNEADAQELKENIASLIGDSSKKSYED